MEIPNKKKIFNYQERQKPQNKLFGESTNLPSNVSASVGVSAVEVEAEAGVDMFWLNNKQTISTTLLLKNNKQTKTRNFLVTPEYLDNDWIWLIGTSDVPATKRKLSRRLRYNKNKKLKWEQEHAEVSYKLEDVPSFPDPLVDSDIIFNPLRV